MISRRALFKTAALGAAAAATSSFPTDLFSWTEPQRVFQPGGPILLNSNENAYGPLPSVLRLPNPFMNANRYPDYSVDILKQTLARQHKIGADPAHGCGCVYRAGPQNGDGNTHL